MGRRRRVQGLELVWVGGAGFRVWSVYCEAELSQTVLVHDILVL